MTDRTLALYERASERAFVEQFGPVGAALLQEVLERSAATGLAHLRRTR